MERAKPALFTALNWSLYGLGADDIGELVSKRAIDEAAVGSDVEMQVQLSFLAWWGAIHRYKGHERRQDSEKADGNAKTTE